MSQTSSFSLPLLGLLIGLMLACGHSAGFLFPNLTMKMVKGVSRSRASGTLLLGIAVLWTLQITLMTDLGEFSSMRQWILLGVVAGGILLWKFVPDFLAPRSLGFLLLLAPAPVLESTFLQHGILKLLLALLAYGWALAGLFLVGMPYLFRDGADWLCADRRRWNAACLGGMAYGILMLGAAIMRLLS